MFWLLIAYLLITQCENTDGKFAEDVECSADHNKQTVASMIITVTKFLICVCEYPGEQKKG